MLSSDIMQLVHSSKNKFLRQIFQVDAAMNVVSFGRGSIKHLAVDPLKVSLLTLVWKSFLHLLDSLCLLGQ